jgi:uncharacterized RDD family membrane protein YckC
MDDAAPERPPLAEDRPDVLGRRIGAALLDILLLALTFLAWSAATGGAKNSGGQVNFSLHGGAFVAWLVFVLAYYFVCEAAWGQTAGKRALGIRVVSEDGGEPTSAAILARTLARLVDALPFAYLIGFLVVLASGRRQQRIGDRLAHTVVTRA